MWYKILSVRRFVHRDHGRFFPFYEVGQDVSTRVAQRRSVCVSVSRHVERIVHGEAGNDNYVLPCPFRNARLEVDFQGCPVRTLNNNVRVANAQVVTRSLPVLRRFIFVHLNRDNSVKGAFRGTSRVVMPLRRAHLLGGSFQCPCCVQVYQVPPKGFAFVFLMPVLCYVTRVPIRTF